MTSWQRDASNKHNDAAIRIYDGDMIMLMIYSQLGCGVIGALGPHIQFSSATV